MALQISGSKLGHNHKQRGGEVYENAIKLELAQNFNRWVFGYHPWAVHLKKRGKWS